MFILLSHKIDILTPMYGGRTGFISESSSSIEKGDMANTSKWKFPNHLGTHIDFPYHFHQNGQTIEDFSTSFWFLNGEKIQILDAKLPEKTFLIEPIHFKQNNLRYDAEFLIFKTGFGRYRNKEKYWKYNPGISLDTAEWIAKNFRKIRLIGLDSISV